MTASQALARTLLLMRLNLVDTVRDDDLLSALRSVRVKFVADALNLASLEGQQAFTTAVLLAARSGATCLVEAPNVALKGLQAPLTERRVIDALIEVGADLIPGHEVLPAGPTVSDVDIAVVLGDSPFSGRANAVIRLSGATWEGRIGPVGSRWDGSSSPFGALAAAGLAAAEPFKAAMRNLRQFAGAGPFDDYFKATPQATVRLAPPGTPPPTPELGHFDFVSGGAVAHAALYALSRIPGVTAEARVFEADSHDLTNVNRYSLLRRTGANEAKGLYLQRLKLAGISVKAMPFRFDEINRRRFDRLAANVLVGVDNVESRWLVQAERPTWLGIGATENYWAMRTIHTVGLACASCVHNVGGAPQGDIPTAAFVSHWGGLALAAAFALRAGGSTIPAAAQVARYACLQLGGLAGIDHARGHSQGDCVSACGAVQGAAVCR